MRSPVAVLAALLSFAALTAAPPAAAQPPLPPLPPPGAECNHPNCTPGIRPGVILGSYCNNTTYYAFGVTEWGRLVFCGSPRRYEPRWFRSPPMAGVKDEGADCHQYLNYVAQAPDGLFLICIAHDGVTTWVRADT